jgi:hypothetical protein
MTNKTYTELETNLQAWLEDNDAEFQGSIAEVINLGQMRLWRDLDLSIFTSEDSSPTVQSNELLVKPVTDTELVSFTALWYDNAGERTFLELRSADWVRDYQVPSVTGAPRFYAELDEDNWALAPIPDAVYTVNTRGVTRLSPLVKTTNETNWLSLHMDDLLFKVCLAEAERFLKSDDRVPIWEQDYMSALPLAKKETYELMQSRYQLTPMETPAIPTIQR